MLDALSSFRDAIRAAGLEPPAVIEPGKLHRFPGAGNLKPVALSAHCCWPSAGLVIAGDDDRLTAGNPGATKAKAAAIVSGALLALPQWPKDAPKHLTDFNDLAVWLAGGGA